MPGIRRVGFFIVVVLLFACPASALAATRYAAPAGTGDCSTVAAACSLTTALSGAAAGDEVLLEAGTYGPIPTALTVTSSGLPITIAPDTGAGRPVVDFSQPTETTQPSLSLSGNVTFTGVDIVGNSSALNLLEADTGALIDRVSVVSNFSGPVDGAAVELDSGAVLRNSMVTQNSTSSTVPNVAPSAGVLSGPTGATGSFSLYNDSIVAPGSGSVAVDLDPDGSPTADATIIDTIMRGNGMDLDSSPNGTGGAVNATVTNSDFDPTHSTASGNVDGEITTITATATVTGLPLFTAEATGDLHEAAGSPTIDAGTADPLAGSFAFDGQARTIGPATDIGADETQNPPVTPPPVVTPPAVGTPSAQATGDTTATVSAPVTAQGSATTVTAQFGATTAYGFSSSAQSAGSGSAPVSQTVTLSGLQPGTLYHARIVAQNAGGATPSTDVIFTTGPAPPVDAISKCKTKALTLTCTSSGGSVSCTISTPSSSKAGAGAGKATVTCKGDTLAVGCAAGAKTTIFCGGLVKGANFTCRLSSASTLSCAGARTLFACVRQGVTITATSGPGGLAKSLTCTFDAGAPLPSLGTLTINSRVLGVGARGSTTIPVRCPAAQSGPCKGEVQLAVPWTSGTPSSGGGAGNTGSGASAATLLGSASSYSSKPGSSTGGALTSPLVVDRALRGAEKATRLPVRGSSPDLLTGKSLDALVRSLGGKTTGVRAGAAAWVIALAPGITAASVRTLLKTISTVRQPPGLAAQPAPASILAALGFVEVALVAQSDISIPVKAIAPGTGLGWATI